MKENNPTYPLNTQYIKDPFFEKDINDIKNKGYITNGSLVSDPGIENTIKEVR